MATSTSLDLRQSSMVTSDELELMESGVRQTVSSRGNQEGGLLVLPKPKRICRCLNHWTEPLFVSTASVGLVAGVGGYFLGDYYTLAAGAVLLTVSTLACYYVHTFKPLKDIETSAIALRLAAQTAQSQLEERQALLENQEEQIRALTTQNSEQRTNIATLTTKIEQLSNIAKKARLAMETLQKTQGAIASEVDELDQLGIELGGNIDEFDVNLDELDSYTEELETQVQTLTKWNQEREDTIKSLQAVDISLKGTAGDFSLLVDKMEDRDVVMSRLLKEREVLQTQLATITKTSEAFQEELLALKNQSAILLEQDQATNRATEKNIERLEAAAKTLDEKEQAAEVEHSRRKEELRVREERITALIEKLSSLAGGGSSTV
jgi:DNA repair exonuclease SbcCD ATPase subunit